MSERITVLLPVDAPTGDALVGPSLAPRPTSTGGAAFGVVDNGLWRSMRAITTRVEAALRARGATAVERTPFDHLSPDFADQQAALGPFGRRVAGAVVGLGN